MTSNGDIFQRLKAADPGWPEWQNLLAIVSELDFRVVRDEYLGSFIVGGNWLSLDPLRDRAKWPGWFPNYVPALLGMKGIHWEMDGGYADRFHGERTRENTLFTDAGNDDQLGYPRIEPLPNLYPFQANHSGALFHVNKDLQILYPDADDERLHVLDDLESFTKKNITQALAREPWFAGYPEFTGAVFD